MMKRISTLKVSFETVRDGLIATSMNAGKIQFGTVTEVVEAHSPRGSSPTCRTSPFFSSACAVSRSNGLYYMTKHSDVS